METQLTNSFDKLVTQGKHIIKISKGPQFNTVGGTYLAMIFLMFSILSIASLFMTEFLYALIFSIISIIIFSIVLDIHGIEVDKNEHKIRDYKLFLWFRIGKWSKINEFKSIYLTQKNVTIATTRYSDHRTDTYHYYHIKLVDEQFKKEILLAEYKNYYKTQHISKFVTETTGLVFKDFVKGNVK
jgi:hypothetical protein